MKMGDIAELGEHQKDINIIYTLWVSAIANYIKYFAETITGNIGIHDILNCVLHAHISGISKTKSNYFACNATKQFYYGVGSIMIAVCLFRKISGINFWPTGKYHR